jgi:hypothetical protein
MQIARFARLLLIGTFPLSLAGTAHGAMLTDEPRVPTASELLIELARHQLTPEVLCIAGFVPAEVDGFVAHAQDSLEEDWDEILSARERVEQARSQLADAVAALNGAGDQQQLADAVALAQAELDAALSAAQNLDAEVRIAFDAGMGSGPRAVVQVVRDNASRGLPLEYLTRSMSDESWMELRHAIAHVSTVQEPDEPDQGIEQILNIYDADPAVTAARTALVLYGVQIRNAYLASLLDG